VTRPPRFVAGAVCPGCGAVDRIVLLVDSMAREWRCVACGFERIARDDGAPIPSDRFAARRDLVDVEPRPIELLPPAKRQEADARSSPTIDEGDR
jgi:uncharacterized metal-binding protein (TIGR02443 family)